MFWVRHIDQCFSDPVPLLVRWPLSLVIRYSAVFTAGVITVAVVTAAGLGSPAGVVAASEVTPRISRVQRAGIVMPVEQVAELASTREPDKAATVLANRGL